MDPEDAKNWKVTFAEKIDWETFRRGTGLKKKQDFKECPVCKVHVVRVDKHMKIHTVAGLNEESAEAPENPSIHEIPSM